MQDLEFNFDPAKNQDKTVYTVSEINSQIKDILEDAYPAVWIGGEISNFKTYSSGHNYFNLKDEKSQIKAVMFAGSASSLTFSPKDGDNVLLFGRISAYTPRGDYQIIVSRIEQRGIGDLAKAFDKLKKQLEAEGLFDPKHKKEIPTLVEKIGIVTSADGAALHDILKVLDDLGDESYILIHPVRVQGDQAQGEISQAIKYLNENFSDLDVLLIGRGGGSIEDLWAFNTEPVARAIFDSQIPTVSCVGHEVDFTISDFVSDLRAPTPSAAAEMIVRKKIELKEKLKTTGKNLFSAVNLILENSSQRLERLKEARLFTKPYAIYEDKIAAVDELDFDMKEALKRLVALKEENLKSATHKLALISPLNVLSRGYSIVKDKEGKILKDASEAREGDLINVMLSQGSLDAKIEKARTS